MTFDEWHKANAKYMEPVDIVDWCREAYEAGRADENEACAQEAENRWLDKAHCTAEEMYEMQKKSIAAAIRARREQ